MRVVHLTPSYIPIFGGTETSIQTQVRFLKQYGVSPEVITLCDTKKWQSSKELQTKTVDGTRVLVWPSYAWGPLRTASNLMLHVHILPASTSILNKHLDYFDVLHFHDVLDLSLPLSCLRSKKPKIFTCDSLYELTEFYRRPSKHFARKLLINSADLFHVFSNADARTLVALGVKRRDIRLIPHGVNVEQFKPPKRTLTKDYVHIVRVGRIEKRKGIADLLKAMRIVNQRYPTRKRIRLSIVGEVWNQAHYMELLEYKKQMQLDQVKFVGFASNLPELLRHADIFVSPSLTETFGIVILEAMAAGLPVIATGVGAIPEVVVENETGFIVPPADPETLAQRMACLITDDQLRQRMGRRGRSRVVSQFSMDRVVPQMVNMYEELTSS